MTRSPVPAFAVAVVAALVSTALAIDRSSWAFVTTIAMFGGLAVGVVRIQNRRDDRERVRDARERTERALHNDVELAATHASGRRALFDKLGIAEFVDDPRPVRGARSR
ncbi:MAG TPA: hypothetical protein VGO00_27925 [Kofleriaceae bacterium]|nr:hypothetical protein [Kofleriaceae bacterium]